MQYRTIAHTTVSAIGLGAMPLSIEHRPDETRAIATVHAALDAGVTLIDTADSYHWHAYEAGHNELLIARALARYGGDTSHVLVATKGGRGRPGDGTWTVTATPAHLKQAAEASAKRLGVDAIGLYQLHKPDPTVPWAESVGALRELLDAGDHPRRRRSPTSPPPRSARHTRSSATGSSPCKTSTRPPSATASPSCS